MNEREIKDSEIVEYLAMGLLADADLEAAENMLRQYDHLYNDYQQVQQLLQYYAMHMGISPDYKLKYEMVRYVLNYGNRIPLCTKSDLLKTSSSRRESEGS